MLFYLKSCDGGVTSYFYLHEYYTKITWSQRFISFTFQCEITWNSNEILYALIEAEKWKILRKEDRNLLQCNVNIVWSMCKKNLIDLFIRWNKDNKHIIWKINKYWRGEVHLFQRPIFFKLFCELVLVGLTRSETYV
jgi:hypothetical protein